MKNVLFAITMENISTARAQQFEEGIAKALRSGSREYSDLNPYHCDHKEVIVKMCVQKNIDVLVVSEGIQGKGDLLAVLKEVKSELPGILIVVLLTNNRTLGDAFLANMVAIGVYNWIAPSLFKTDYIANTIISPKKLKDVEAFMPRIVEGKDGLAFNAVVVDKLPEDLEDIEETPDILSSNTNNALKVNVLNDIDTEIKTETSGYFRKMARSNFGFGRLSKPRLVENEEVIETPIASETPITPETNVFTTLDDVVESEPVPEAKKEDRQSVLNALLEKYSKPVEEKVEEPKVEMPRVEKPRIEEPKKTKAENDSLKAFIEATGKPVNKNLMNRADEVFGGVGLKKSFVPKYQKLLFVRALPISSAIPVHIAKMCNAKFVDYNKNSSNTGYFEDMITSTIKEGFVPEGLVVADVVAGNGVEALAKKFEKVIIIVPEDAYAIERFVSLNPWAETCGFVIDKATTGVTPIRQLIRMLPKAEHVDSVKTENCGKVLAASCVDRKLILNEPEYVNALRFLVQRLEA